MKFLEHTIFLFRHYKSLAEKAMAQVSDESLAWPAGTQDNSISTIVKHLHGNMLSRWTAFLTEDGEKPWRQRDAEFEETELPRAKLLQLWEDGWQCMFDALVPLTEGDLDRTVYIRNEGHAVMDALMRQLAHYSYHVGQIILLSKMQAKEGWESLTIPRNASAAYNAGKFASEKGNRHFTKNV